MRIVKVVLLVALLLVGVFAGTVATQAFLQKRAATDVMASYGLPFIASPQDAFAADRIAVLLLGIDYNYNAKDIEYSTNARTDMIKAVSLVFPTPSLPNGRIDVLSVLRDTAYTYPDGHRDKINAAYSGFSDNRMAAHASERAVGAFLGLPHGFTKYVTLRADATKDLIDAIGGIDVVANETMNYDDSWGHLHIHFVGGTHYHMNGDEAVSYARFRHDACSDPCRSKRQDQVIKTTLAKLEHDKFNDLVHMNSLIDVLRRNVYTDLSEPQILSLAWAYSHTDLKRVVYAQVPSTGDEQLACCGDTLIPDDAAKTALVQKFFVDTPAGEPLPSASAVAAVDPHAVHVVVENGSGVAGIGHRAAGILSRQGFIIDRVGNARTFTFDTTHIAVRGGQPLAGDRIAHALALRGALVRPETSATITPGSTDVTITIGRDYANVVR